LDNDDGTAVARLTIAELIALTKRAFSRRGLESKGYQLFNAIYDKLQVGLAFAQVRKKNGFRDRLKAMRDALVSEAVTFAEIYFFVDDITKNRWHLQTGITTDRYTWGTIIDKTLPVLLATYVKDFMPHNAHALKQHRHCAKLLKSSMGNRAYNEVMVELLPIISAALPDDKQDFARYYLPNESAIDVYQAAAKTASQFSNQHLRELYQLVIGNAEAAYHLSLEPRASGDKFLHHLLRREIDASANFSCQHIFKWCYRAC
jgi:hypothetical protein